jgi:hypothetical protein
METPRRRLGAMDRPSESYESWNDEALRDEAAERRIPGHEEMDRPELIEALQESDARSDAGPPEDAVTGVQPGDWDDVPDAGK